MNSRRLQAAKYLEKPYARRLTPDGEGGYVATIQEFPGLLAEGASAEEALRNLEKSALAWVEASLAMGNAIPEPVDLSGYSGKIALRMPRGLHRRAAEMAASENTSLNQWIVSAVAHYLGGKEAVKVVVDSYLMHVDVYSTSSNTYNIQTWNVVVPQVGNSYYPYLDLPGGQAAGVIYTPWWHPSGAGYGQASGYLIGTGEKKHG